MNLASYKAGNNVKTFLLRRGAHRRCSCVDRIPHRRCQRAHRLRRHRGGLQLRDVLVQRQDRAEDEQGGRGERGGGARAAPHDRRRSPQRAGVPKPARLRDPGRAAERVRDRPQPQARRDRGHPGHPARTCPATRLEGVLAHEMAHIKNRDILIASIAAMIAGAISAIANFLQFSLFFGGDDDNPLGLIGTLATIILAPLAAVDHPARRLAPARVRGRRDRRRAARRPRTRSPTRSRRCSAGAEAIPMKVNPAAAPLYIVNPLAAQARGAGGVAKLFSTHPPMEERVARLRRDGGRQQPPDSDLLRSNGYPGRGQEAGQHRVGEAQAAHRVRRAAAPNGRAQPRGRARGPLRHEPHLRRSSGGRCSRSPRWSRPPATSCSRRCAPQLEALGGGAERAAARSATIGPVGVDSDGRRGGWGSSESPPAASVSGPRGRRVREFFIQNETIILFAQGLVFFSLGFAVWLQRRRATRLTLSSSLIWLAAFAFVEALAVWGYVFVPIQETYLGDGRHRRPDRAARARAGRRLPLPRPVRPAPDRHAGASCAAR